MLLCPIMVFITVGIVSARFALASIARKSIGVVGLGFVRLCLTVGLAPRLNVIGLFISKSTKYIGLFESIDALMR